MKGIGGHDMDSGKRGREALHDVARSRELPSSMMHSAAPRGAGCLTPTISQPVPRPTQAPRDVGTGRIYGKWERSTVSPHTQAQGASPNDFSSLR